MSIHDFHSKLMSGKEEGKLFQALRKVRIGGPMMAADAVSGWSVWVGESSAEQGPGWSAWMEDGPETVSGT